MQITKFGHSCLLVAEGELRVLIDPGKYSSGQNDLTNLDAILLTHEHNDHIDFESLKILIKNNPEVRIITNKGVAPLCEARTIHASILEDGEREIVRGVPIEGCGKLHAAIYSSLPDLANTGYIIAERFFYPGDALTIPKRAIEFLALPVAGPWLKLQEAIDYTLVVKPKICFPVHDGILKSIGTPHSVPPQILEPYGIKFQIPSAGISLTL